MDSRPSLRIVSWNIRGIGGVGSHRLERQADALAAHDPDVVVLTEVGSRGDLADQVRDHVAGIGIGYFLFSGARKAATEKGKPYGNVVASRWPLEPHSWPRYTTWPQLIIAAQVDWCGSPVMIVGAHIPNGSGNGWEKVYALEVLASGLSQLAVPTILAGDFNEPKRFHPNLLSFGADHRGRLGGTFTDLHGVTHDRQRWQDAVEDVLTPRSRGDGGWGGRHVVLQAGGDFGDNPSSRRALPEVLRPHPHQRRAPAGGRGRVRPRGARRHEPTQRSLDDRRVDRIDPAWLTLVPSSGCSFRAQPSDRPAHRACPQFEDVCPARAVGDGWPGAATCGQ